MADLLASDDVRRGVVLSLVSGVVADAVDRKKLMLVTQILMTLAATGLAVVTYHGVTATWPIYLLTALSSAAGTNYSAYRLPFNAFAFTGDGRSITFNAGNRRWVCDVSGATCDGTRRPMEPPSLTSPDGKSAAFIRDNNLCLRCHAQVPNQGGPGTLYIGNVNHNGFVARGTCWSAGCHTAVHGSNVQPFYLY